MCPRIQINKRIDDFLKILNKYETKHLDLQCQKFSDKTAREIIPKCVYAIGSLETIKLPTMTVSCLDKCFEELIKVETNIKLLHILVDPYDQPVLYNLKSLCGISDFVEIIMRKPFGNFIDYTVYKKLCQWIPPVNMNSYVSFRHFDPLMEIFIKKFRKIKVDRLCIEFNFNSVSNILMKVAIHNVLENLNITELMVLKLFSILDLKRILMKSTGLRKLLLWSRWDDVNENQFILNYGDWNDKSNLEELVWVVLGNSKIIASTDPFKSDGIKYNSKKTYDRILNFNDVRLIIAQKLPALTNFVLVEVNLDP